MAAEPTGVAEILATMDHAPDPYAVCSHLNCLHVSNIARKAGRKQAMSRHVAAYLVHQEHFASSRDQCAECQRLLSAGIWSESSVVNARKYKQRALTSNLKRERKNRGDIVACEQPAFKTQFVETLHAVASAPENADVISWDETGAVLIISDSKRFASEILPLHFQGQTLFWFMNTARRHKFVRQKRAEHSRGMLVFRHPYFQRPYHQLLHHIEHKGDPFTHDEGAWRSRGRPRKHPPPAPQTPAACATVTLEPELVPEVELKLDPSPRRALW
jgi:hypothetical protein